MTCFTSKASRVIDCHMHLDAHIPRAEQFASLFAIRDHLGYAATTLCAIYSPHFAAATPEILYAKAASPTTVYAFGGLNHASKETLPEQLTRMLAAGCDGVKLIESNPFRRKTLDYPMDGEYWRDFFSEVERLQTPLVWHVANPESDWTPPTASEEVARWSAIFGADRPSKDTYYAETLQVLRRHPRLRVMLAHVFFLSFDLARAQRYMEDYPNMGLDLAMGIEYLIGFSQHTDASRDFFLRYADRIYYGTDMTPDWSLPRAEEWSGLIQRFLETDDVWDLPEWFHSEPRTVRGIALPGEALEKIYHANFEALVGMRPKPIYLTLIKEIEERDMANSPV